MLRKQVTILSDGDRFPTFFSRAIGMSDRHHRYYGSSVCSGGERIAETRYANPSSIFLVSRP